MLIKTSNFRTNPYTGKKEFWFECPNMCHGFGVCGYCNDKGGVWDILRPQFTSRTVGDVFGRSRGCF